MRCSSNRAGWSDIVGTALAIITGSTSFRVIPEWGAVLESSHQVQCEVMRTPGIVAGTLAGICGLLASSQASAQAAEATGSRAPGMAGAFVAVASDSSAIWWNPAGLAAGPFLDMAITRANLEASGRLPARQNEITGVTFATPPLGIGYQHFRLTSVTNEASAGQGGPGGGAGRSVIQVLSGSQFGVTIVHSIVSGVHAGATFKTVGGSFSAGAGEPGAAPSALLESAGALAPGEHERHFDIDVGLLAVAGPLRLGARVQNLLEPEFGPVRLTRQTRIGVAVDPEPTSGVPLTIAVDVDVDKYTTSSGDRRVVALGTEYWVFSRRLGLRAGARFNTVGAQERGAAAGASVAIRRNLFIDAHASGGRDDERGWGLATRVSF
jgi:hypothetical protein